MVPSHRTRSHSPAHHTETDRLLPHPADPSVPSPASSSSAGPGPAAATAPKLRTAVRRLQHVRQATAALPVDFGASGVGAEPGIDPALADLAHLAAPLAASVTQWSATAVDRADFGAADGAAFGAWLEVFDARAEENRGRVTWINIDGLNGRALRQLGAKFALHPLALEDAVHLSRLSQSKANWYSDLLFVRLIASELSPLPDPPPTHDPAPAPTRRSGGPLAALSRLGQRLVRLDADLAALRGARGHLEGGLGRGAEDEDAEREGEDGEDKSAEGGPTGDAHLDPTAAARDVLKRLTARSRVPLRRQQLSIFLTASGTVISVFSRSGAALLAPIHARLATPGTLLRSGAWSDPASAAAAADGSLVVHALLDVVVDELMAVADELRFRLDVLEGQALLRPEPQLVRHLHVLSSQLLSLKRSVTPIHSLVRALKNDDERRSDLALRRSPATGTRPPTTDAAFQSSVTDDVPGHLSPAARLYMQDIDDHLEALVDGLELLAARAAALVDLVFNSLSFAANRNMSLLTLSTVFFLPLTFVTGYFGMNFRVLPLAGVFPDGIEPHGPNPDGSVAYFWLVCTVIAGALVTAFVLARVGVDVGVSGFKLLNRRHDRARTLLPAQR